MTYTTRPITGWQGTPTEHRRRSPFDSTWTSTLTLLDHELRQLRATAPVLQLDISEADLRLDGQIRANAKTASPRVRLLFDTPDRGTLAFQCDRFTTWPDNVRAIALGLEALRKVDRYGISSGGEQYKGYLAIEAPADRWGRHRTPEQVLRHYSGLSELGFPIGTRMWRQARAAAHPDRHDGDQTAWDLVEAAARALGVAK